MDGSRLSTCMYIIILKITSAITVRTGLRGESGLWSTLYQSAIDDTNYYWLSLSPTLGRQIKCFDWPWEDNMQEHDNSLCEGEGMVEGKREYVVHTYIHVYDNIFKNWTLSISIVFYYCK